MVSNFYNESELSVKENIVSKLYHNDRVISNACLGYYLKNLTPSIHRCVPALALQSQIFLLSLIYFNLGSER